MTTNPHAFADHVDQLYEAGKDDELIHLALDSWLKAGEPLRAGVAEACRLARVCCIRSADALPPGDQAAQALMSKAHLLEARTFVAAALTGESRVVALTLLPNFFRLIARGAFDQAREVLDDMERLVNDGPQCLEGTDEQVGRPFPRVARRIIAERRAYSFYVEGRFNDAAAQYGVAQQFTKTNSRGALKVRGGQLLALFQASGRNAMALSELQRGLSTILDLARAQGFPDVVAWSASNLEKIQKSQLDSWVPFDNP